MLPLLSSEEQELLEGFSGMDSQHQRPRGQETEGAAHLGSWIHPRLAVMH